MIDRERRMLSSTCGVPTFAFHLQNWKRPIFERYFPERSFAYVPLYIDDDRFTKIWAPAIAGTPDAEIFVWSRNIPAAATAFARKNNIPVHFIEDGFIRSLHPSAGYTAPFSLILDRQTPYFDSRSPSDLEDMLNGYAFDDDEPLMARARRGIEALVSMRLSKYNVEAGPLREVPPAGPGGTKRVLVLGQVENDASILLGCPVPVTNNDLVRLAAAENPGCDIVYKPHPDVLRGVRKHLSDPADVAHLCRMITESMPLADLLDGADHVYTITSLAGFEALLRRKTVTVMGAPFYAGWGLTDDRQAHPRRRRTLTLEALFAAAYLLYPRYFDPLTGDRLTFETCLEHMAAWRASGKTSETLPFRPAAPRWKPVGPYGLLGWRHLLTQIVARFIARIGYPDDVIYYRSDPVGFFREVPKLHHRLIGRILYPFDGRRPSQRIETAERLRASGDDLNLTKP